MIETPSPFTDPNDLVNLSQVCIDCKSHKVIYHIAVPAPSFPIGSYCYRCLLNHCKASHRIPMPMENNLLDSLQRDLGMFNPNKRFYFVPEGHYEPPPSLH